MCQREEFARHLPSSLVLKLLIAVAFEISKSPDFMSSPRWLSSFFFLNLSILMATPKIHLIFWCRPLDECWVFLRVSLYDVNRRGWMLRYRLLASAVFFLRGEGYSKKAKPQLLAQTNWEPCTNQDRPMPPPQETRPYQGFINHDCSLIIPQQGPISVGEWLGGYP